MPNETPPRQCSPGGWAPAGDRPDVALITNHGYGGARLPVGGAPDTGGQNLYVNTLALVLERLGYRVTIFARGGFPHFEREGIRDEPELLSDHVRYVFMMGGGDHFIRKEDIAIALDEELEWLDRFIRREAEARDCPPWAVYEFVNSHYWDAAVLGTRLVERWRNDVVEAFARRVLEGIAPEPAVDAPREDRAWRALGEMPGFHLGRLLLESAGDDRPVAEAVGVAAARWTRQNDLAPDVERAIGADVRAVLAANETERDPAGQRLIAYGALGTALLRHGPELGATLDRDLARVDRHVWTPHSLGELKDFNYREEPAGDRRALKFCERRSHERMIAARTRAFAATSAEIAERLWTHYRVDPERTFHFPPCVDGTVFRPYGSAEKADTYRYLAAIGGIDPTALASATIVFETSRMDRTKRKDVLLAAFARVAPRHDDAYLFVGGGPENEVHQALQAQIDATEALRGRAFVTGAIPDAHIGPMFSIADIYASASEMEGFGMCVSQAAAAGAAIASTDVIPFSVDYAPDHIELFAPGDVEGLAAALDRLVEHPEMRREIGRHLRECVTTLDWEHRTVAFLAYLRRVGFEIAEGGRAS